MHLGYKTSKYKNTVYKSYFIAQSCREGHKVFKRIIWPLGKLTDDQARQIRLICKVASSEQMVLTAIENILIAETKPFLELAVVNALWEQWGFSNAFRSHLTDSELSTPLVAKILTINRCVSPCSHFSIPQWVQNTAISEIVEHRLDKLNDDKIYRELDKIAVNQRHLENHLFNITYKQNSTSYDVINYDLSSSYFVGNKCELSAYGNSKDDKPHNKQVVLGVLVNSFGFPFKWDVYPGNMAEVKTLANQIKSLTKRFHLKNITLVFDRGLVSSENLNSISKNKLKYISALDKPQIPKIEGIELDIFNELTVDNCCEKLLQHQFIRYDDSLYYKDLGVINQQRHVIGFNPILFKQERQCLTSKIKDFEHFIAAKNKELSQAKRSRKAEPLLLCILGELRRLKIRKYFFEPILQEITLKRSNKNGQKTVVKSFVVTIQKKTTQIRNSEALNGVFLFVSNHTESSNNTFLLNAKSIIKIYREKTKIEDAFKHVKSFLKIRPFYVNTQEHVKAVYSLCILAYFLNKDLAERIQKISGVDYLNSKNLYEPFRNCHYVTVQDQFTGRKKSEPVQLTYEQQKLLEKLKIEIKMPQKIV